MRTLFFDVDGGLNTNKSHPPSQAMFKEIPPIPIADGPKELMEVVTQFARREQVEISHPLTPNKTLTVTKVVASSNFLEHGVKAIVIDTGSTLASQGRIRIAREQEEETMTQRGWGIHGDQQVRLYNFLGHWKDMIVIVNMHIDDIKDEESGAIVWVPAVKGGAKTQLHNYFDAVLFNHTDTTKDKTDPERYMWRLSPKRGAIGGVRGIECEDLIPQDYGLLIQKFFDAEIMDPKILVLGPSKTGKTYALRSLVEYQHNQETK